MINAVVLGCVAFGMFLVGFFWGFIFGQISKGDDKK